MPSTLSKFLAIFVAALLAAGAIVASPLTASAATDSSITLSVLDQNGSPLAGATVERLTFYNPNDGSETSAPAELAEDPDRVGVFEVGELSDSQWARVRVSASGFDSSEVYYLLESGDRSVQLIPTVISGTVVGDDDAPVADGTAELYEAGATTPLASAPISDGTYRFTSVVHGSYFLRFSADGYQSAVSDGQADTLPAATTFAVENTVTEDATLAKFHGVTLNYTQNYYGRHGTTYFERFNGDTYDYVGSLDDGTDYEGSHTENLTAGYYRVTTYFPGSATVKRFVTISGRDVTLPTIALSFDPSYAGARYYAYLKAPTTSIVLTAYQQVTPGNWQPVDSTSSTGVDDFLQLALTPGGVYRFVISDPSGLYKTRALATDTTFTDAPDGGAIDVAALPSNYDSSADAGFYDYNQGSLTLAVDASTGRFTYFDQPVPYASVMVWEKIGGEFEQKQTIGADANGTFTTYLTPGEYTVSAWADGYLDVPRDDAHTIVITGADGGDFGTRSFAHVTNPTLSGTLTDQYGVPYSTEVTLQRDDHTDWIDVDSTTADAAGAYSFSVTDGQSYRVVIGNVTSGEYDVEPSAVVPSIAVIDDDAAPPTAIDTTPSLPDAKVGLAAAPDVAWRDGWSTSSVEWSIDGTPVTDADGTYTPEFGDLGKALSAVVTGSNGAFGYILDLGPVTIGENAFADAEVSIQSESESAHVGDLLIADPNWGTDGVTSTFSWTRDGNPIGGDSDSYALTEADFGATIAVSVAGSKAGYESDTHAGEYAVALGSLDRASVSIAGDGTIGSTLTASVTGIPSDIPVTYTWYSEPDADVAGTTTRSSTAARDQRADFVATGSTHVLTAADFSYGLYVVATTEPTAVYEAFNRYAYPELAYLTMTDATATVSGTAAAGQVLTAAIASAPTGATFSATWYSSDEYGYDHSFTVPASDVGRDLRVRIRISAPGYTGKKVYVYTHITGPAQTPGTATISGGHQVGDWLQASVGDWVKPTELDGLDYGWYIDDTLVAEGDEYQIQSGDRGKTIQFRATGHAEGYDVGVAAASVTVPLDTFTAGTPKVTGSNVVGSVLTAATGTWPTGVALDLQWLRDGVNIAGETGLTHTVTTADQGTNITFRVTASRPNFASKIVTVTTAIPAADVPPTIIEKIVTVTTMVTVHTFGATPAPKISGSAKVGKTLTVKATAWKPGATFSFRWYANGKAIAGATKSTLKLTTSVKGKRITVKATGSRNGYQTAVATSAATSKVAKK